MVDDQSEAAAPKVGTPVADALESGEEFDLGDGVVEREVVNVAPVPELDDQLDQYDEQLAEERNRTLAASMDAEQTRAQHAELLEQVERGERAVARLEAELAEWVDIEGPVSPDRPTRASFELGQLNPVFDPTFEHAEADAKPEFKRRETQSPTASPSTGWW